MNNKRGFTLIEVLSVVAIIALVMAIGVPTFINIRKGVLTKQYDNVKLKIEDAAEKYAKDTRVITMSVGKLIEEGYLMPDDNDNIYNPINNESLNCKIVEVSGENGNYVASLTENGTEKDGKCSDYEVKVDSLIEASCFSEEGSVDKCNESLKNTNNVWYSGQVKLTVKPIDGKEISTYRWSSLTGDASSLDNVVVMTNEIKTTTYSIALTFTDGSVAESSLDVKVDNQKPVIVDIIKDDNWSKDAKSVSIKASDGAGSGVNSYYIGSDNTCNGDYQSSNEFALDEGTYYACVKDKAGNISDVRELVIEHIDREKPEVKKNGDKIFETYSSTMGITYYSELTRKVTFVDNESGIAHVLYCFTNKDKCEPTKEATIEQKNESTALLSFEANKEKTRVCVKALDGAGNETEVYCDETFLVDNTKPVDLKVSLDKNNSSIINVITKDNESDIYKIVCNYGTSSNTLNNSVEAKDGVCDLGRLASGVTYYVKVAAYNNANLVESTNTSFASKITVASAYKTICKDKAYCDDKYYIDYNGKKFIMYTNDNGYKAVLDNVGDYLYFLSNGCCNKGNCTYDNSNFTTASNINYYLNVSFLNQLANYKNKLDYATWFTGPYDDYKSRDTSAYVGLMNYNDYENTRNYAWFYENAQNFWLATPNKISSKSYYQQQMIVVSQFKTTAEILKAEAYARPAVAFKGNDVFTSGDGSKNNPYRIL